MRSIALTEIFVGVGFVALMLSIAFPVYTNARERTRQESCFANLKALARGIQTYCEDYDGHLPGAHLAGCGYWHERITPYLRETDGQANLDVFHCPGWPGGFVFDPPLRYRGDPPIGYGYNECLSAAAGVGGMSRGDVQRPSEIVMLGDSGPWWCKERQEWQVDMDAAIINCGDCIAMHLFRPEKRRTLHPVYTRHNGYGNVAFVDGHVKLVTQEFLADESHF